MADDIQSIIANTATKYGIDPNWALAVADRESKFDPNAHADQTIHGIFQMTKGLRDAYGAGDSSDPTAQAEGFMKYVNGEIRPQMKQALGRDPTSQEMYLGHHFGPARAAKMIASGHPETPVADVFSRRERALNPHFDKAGTTGNLMSSINSDMDARTAKFGGGAQVAGTTPANTAATPFDYSAFGPAVGANGADMLDESPAAKTANKSSAPQQTAQAQEDDGAPQLTAPRFSQPKPVSIPAAAKTQVAQNAVPMPKLPSLSKASFGLDPSKVLAARPDQLAPGLSLLMGQPNA